MEINELAYDFTLPDETGKLHTLSDYRGSKVVLYFYPKDSTSGCTLQALEFKRLYKEFEELNAIIIGISKDSVKSHLNFKTKNELPFILLSDESLEVLKKYDVYKEKTMYGRKYFGVVRTTFVINEEGRIISKEEKVNASKNPSDTLKFLQ